jgi:hypothetical protein
MGPARVSLFLTLSIFAALCMFGLLALACGSGLLAALARGKCEMCLQMLAFLGISDRTGQW